jgi:hypothetical protein
MRWTSPFFLPRAGRSTVANIMRHWYNTATVHTCTSTVQYARCAYCQVRLSQTEPNPCIIIAQRLSHYHYHSSPLPFPAWDCLGAFLCFFFFFLHSSTCILVYSYTLLVRLWWWWFPGSGAFRWLDVWHGVDACMGCVRLWSSFFSFFSFHALLVFTSRS